MSSEEVKESTRTIESTADTASVELTSSEGNGKREREEDEEELNAAKQLKSSDDSDGKEETADSGRSSTTDDEPKPAANVSPPKAAPRDANDSSVTDDPPEPDVTTKVHQNTAEEATATGRATNPGPAAQNPSSVLPAPEVATDPRMPHSSAPTAGNPFPPMAAMDPNVVATVTNPEQVVEEVGTVSALYVGRVIGKGGEMIRDLQARSGCRMDVDQNVPIGQPRVITYRGTRATVDFAKHLVQLLCTEGVTDNDLPLGNAAQEHVIIPAQSVGKVIGRGGEMIRELQSRSQAKIQIDHSGQSGIPIDQKQVTITGTHEAVTKGKEMVLLLVANPLMDAQVALNMLIDDKTRGGSQWGSGPPYANLPNQGINMQPHMAPQYAGGVAQGYGMYGGPAGGVPTTGYPSFATGTLAYPQASQTTYLGDGRETELIFVSKQFMGRIIGSKGVTINDLQRRSACDIQINQDVPPGKDCEVTIKGSRMGIDSAKAMIQEIIEVGPHHPYAGGMENYSGGMKSAGMAGSGGYHGAYAQPQYAPAQYNPYQQPTAYDPAAYGQVVYNPQPMTSSGYGAPIMGSAAYGQPMAQAPTASSYPPAAYGGGYATVAPPPRPGAPPTASPWKAATAPDGQIYYYNELTGETQWEKPPGMP
jgi:predicted RNA-binding protein YlqC (UPF0109 family)